MLDTTFDMPTDDDAQVLAYADQQAFTGAWEVVDRATGKLQGRPLTLQESACAGRCLENGWLTVDTMRLTDLGRLALNRWIDRHKNTAVALRIG